MLKKTVAFLIAALFGITTFLFVAPVSALAAEKSTDATSMVKVQKSKKCSKKKKKCKKSTKKEETKTETSTTEPDTTSTSPSST